MHAMDKIRPLGCNNRLSRPAVSQFRTEQALTDTLSDSMALWAGILTIS